MNSDAIRRAFLDYFVERGHLEVPSLPLATNDPSITTLFTIAGMQQMIPYFMGQATPPSRRLVNVQRAVRTNDIEEVGDDSHLTYLEMLGNFSVGDYFKKESVAYTWDFLTRVMGIPAERWWVTHYPGDEEARQGWIAAGVSPDRLGPTEENWWGPPGAFGPCGPCSEIHYDRGMEYSCGRPDCRPETECCDRFVEVWNNVFMQYFQDEAGNRRPLPWNNIDTGMGFERLAMVVQGASSVYGTDLFQPIVQAIAEKAHAEYGRDHAIDRSLRIISDHSRAITFIIADGVMPSSEGRGYVLRRLIRRAAMRGRLLGIEGPFLTDPISVVIEIMSGYHTYLQERRGHILQVVQQEENRFLQTLTRGLAIFEDFAETAVRNGRTISGEDAFTLHDTYGFPLELTAELAAERGLDVDREGFRHALQQQQARSAAHQKAGTIVATSPETYVALAATIPPTLFTGYDELRTTTELVGIIAGGELVTRAVEGDMVEMVLAVTPFYAESGGQVGDTGFIRHDGGVARVMDTQRPHAGLVVHKAGIVDGSFAVGDAVEAEVDTERRLHILPHHTGTHMLHKALQEVLGPDATQEGSLVAPDRLRFDFRSARPLTPDELREVQDRINAAIWANLPVTKEIMSYDDAMRAGAMALFGEKYGDRVRVVSIGDWSKELCGGTHVEATGDIGLLVITGETGIGSGVRRIEALAGAAAYTYVNGLREELAAVARALEAKPDQLVPRADHVMRELHEQEKRIETLTRALAAREAEALLRQGLSIDGMTVVANQISAESRDYLKATTDAVKAHLKSGIVILGAVVDGSPAFTMAVTRDLNEEGFHAGSLLREAAQRAGGSAGGRAEFAQGGGKDATRVGEVLKTAVDLIRQKAEG